MCDTLCALPSFTNHAALFAKNSDRSPNEPHIVVKHGARSHGSKLLKCTYIEVEQAQRTFSTLLFKPSWIWGAEMGVNEFGVAIGNEAVFTKARKGPPALLGMDILRLALERSHDATEAVDVITGMLERYGQGGNCGFDHEFRYDNSFLVCDGSSGYIVETAGKKYEISGINHTGSISNRLDLQGFKRNNEPVFTHFSRSQQRLQSTRRSLSGMHGKCDVTAMIAALRKHHPADEGGEFSGSVRSVCMHAGKMIGDHTTGSVVIEIGQNINVWATGASTPCISVFKPVGFDAATRPAFEEGREAQAVEYWLEREKLHRCVLNGSVDIAAVRSARDELEAQFLAEGFPEEPKARLEYCSDCAAKEQALIDRFSTSNWREAKTRYWAGKNAALPGNLL